MKKGYGSILKKHRELANVSVKEISDYLIANGVKASESTIYSWENNNSEPKPGAFLLMCAKYGITDIFKTFGYEPLTTESSQNIIESHGDADILQKYNSLNREGRMKADAYVDDLSGNEKYKKDIDSEGKAM